MLKKRLIGVVTVKDGLAVQSFGYSRYLPIGRPEFLVENLDRWGADEIVVQVVDSNRSVDNHDFELITRLGKLGISTPLVYGGGIRSVTDASKIIRLGADRIFLDSVLHDDMSIVEKISLKFGSQAVILSLPLCLRNDVLMHFDYKKRCLKPIESEMLDLLSGDRFHEVMAIDFENEGSPNAFCEEIVEQLPCKRNSVIAFGGISDHLQSERILELPKVCAIAVGNFLSYQEHAVQLRKENINGDKLRLAAFQSNEGVVNG